MEIPTVTNRDCMGFGVFFLIVSQVKSKPKGNLAARGSFLIADEQRATAIGDHSPAKHRKGRNTIFYSELKGLLTCPKT